MVGNTGTRNFNFYLFNNGGQICLHFSPGGSAGSVSNALAYTTGNWATFAVTQDTSNNHSFYYNGKFVNTVNNGVGSFAQYTSGQSEYVGRADNYWWGPLSVVSVYGRVLTASEIMRCHQAVRTRYGLA